MTRGRPPLPGPEEPHTVAELLRKRVKDLLRRSGRTQQDLARTLGISPSTLSEAMNGRHDLTLSEIDAIAAYFRTSVPELFDPMYYAAWKPEWQDRRSGRDRRSHRERRGPWQPQRVRRTG